MNITIKFFAILKDVAATDHMTMPLDDGANIAAAIDKLRIQFPALAKHLLRIAYAVNREYVQSDYRLKEGDELALIPPVSGG